MEQGNTDITAGSGPNPVISDVRAAFDKVEAQNSASQETSSPEAKDVAPEPKTAKPTKETKPQKAEKPLPKQAKAPKEEKTDLVVQSDEAPKEAATIEPEPITPPVEEVVPPASWTNEEKEAFRNSPLAAQKAYARREKDVRRLIRQHSEDFAKSQGKYSELDETFKPYEQELQRAGVKPAQIVNELLGVHKALRANAPAAILDLCYGNGVDPAMLVQLAQNGYAPSRQQYRDPAVQQLQSEIQALRSEREQEKQSYLQQENEGVNQEIENFALETNEEGKPVREFFEEVEEDMAIIAQALREQRPKASTRELLEEAYDRAVYANPDVRRILLNRQQLAAAREKSAKARAAAVSVTGAPGGGISPSEPRTVQEAAEAAWAKVHGA